MSTCTPTTRRARVAMSCREHHSQEFDFNKTGVGLVYEFQGNEVGCASNEAIADLKFVEGTSVHENAAYARFAFTCCKVNVPPDVDTLFEARGDEGAVRFYAQVQTGEKNSLVMEVLDGLGRTVAAIANIQVGMRNTPALVIGRQKS